jgi:hypothetical protein
MTQDHTIRDAGAGMSSRRKGIPPQFTRLILLALVIVGTYLVARHFLVPASFGEYGWYRGDALRERAALPIVYAGRAACAECHSEVAEGLTKTKHATVSCESCHGPNAAHADDPTALPAKIADPRFCVRCHAASPSRPTGFPQVDVAAHAQNQGCTECHQPHDPTEAPSK